jgi:periplasmic copper chaperone A
MDKIKYFLLLSFLIPNLLIAKESKPVQISEVWINEAPPTVSALAAYATIENISNREQILISVSSDSFSSIEIHLSKIIDDMAKMKKQESLIIPANGTIELSPGSYHLMLFNPERPLKVDDKISIVFTFANGLTYTTEATVKKNMAGHKHHHHHHDH